MLFNGLLQTMTAANHLSYRMLKILFLCFLFIYSSLIIAAEVDFSDNYARIYQIRVVSSDAGGKSSIGSGFQVSADGLIITNYHVISQFVNAPEVHKIEYVTDNGNKGQLQLLDFDVISDLAVLRHPEPASDFFTINDQGLDKGQIAHALGNPGDWGMIMVSGPTNGYVEHSYEDRVLFSGSLNPGMSGGPSLNDDGEIVGINVATAGSQLSFLVPAKKASVLLNKERTLDADNYQEEIAQQIKAWQGSRLKTLIEDEWPAEEFIDKALFGEIRRDFQCWGSTNEADKDRDVANVDKQCRAGDDIFLAYDLNAGQISFHLHSRESIKLNSMQFAERQRTVLWADNNSSFDHSTNYECESDFIETSENEEGYRRVISCVRAFKKLPGLYDSLLLIQHHQALKSFRAHLSLSAVEKSQIRAIHERFLRALL